MNENTEKKRREIERQRKIERVIRVGRKRREICEGERKTKQKKREREVDETRCK